MQNIGVVIIGRNEGERLKRCVRSVIGNRTIVVYVDSGSEDNSAHYCRETGIKVIDLDMSTPFSAARARNTGMNWLVKHHPEIDYLQFIDGDCELIDGWLKNAYSALQDNPKLAIVCGLRKERYPDQSIYNQLCDVEWNTTIGLTDACGGDFLARINALLEENGFNPTVIAGEEPDLCYRLRMRGWSIKRLDTDMTWHDAMITRFTQWWRRTLRAGHAYAHNLVLHWGGAENHYARTIVSIFGWGLVIPAGLIASVLLSATAVTLFILFLYMLMILKIAYNLAHTKHYSLVTSLQYGFFTMLGKIPQTLGILMFLKKRLKSDSYSIIEYK